MGRLKVGLFSVMVATALVAVSCAGGSPSSGGNGGGGGGAPAGGGASAPAGGGGGNVAGGGDISKVDACSLLKPADIQQVLGVAMMAGVNQDSDIVKQCEWDPQDGAPTITVGITVRTFDPGQWQVISEFPNAAAVSGLGDAAYKGSPLKGDLSVKAKGYEIDLGTVNFSTKSDAVIDQANLDLMKLVLTRL
jgi:hypothetical protein